MRTKVKLKGGISLIVLVITIIVMIILAAAIILSLSNSGIISKANKAKTDSDTANLKEYVNTLRAEWELMTAEEQEAKGSFEAYANEKLAANGYKGAVGTDGEVYSNLNENAMAAIKAGIKVGDVVTGYTVTANTYETSGEENTAPSRTETDPTKQTVTTNTDITWKYLGVNANGELEIMADFGEAVAVANTKVKLSGKGGYLKGPDMLNKVCENLYSVEGKGTARNMNIDDVNNILGYTGEKGAYYDSANGSYTPTKEAMKIGDIVSKKGEPALSDTATPDGRDINTYYSDYYYINKTNDVKEMKNPGNRDLVYNAKNTYWLASPCVYAYFNYSNAAFDVRYVYSTGVSAGIMFNSHGNSSGLTCAVRPVVSLKSNVQLEQNAEKTAWEIK